MFVNKYHHERSEVKRIRRIYAFALSYKYFYLEKILYNRDGVQKSSLKYETNDHHLKPAYTSDENTNEMHLYHNEGLI